MTVPRDFRDLVRMEAQRLEGIALKENGRLPSLRRQHIIDGLNVAVQSLRKLAAQWAQEAQSEEILEVASGNDSNPPRP